MNLESFVSRIRGAAPAGTVFRNPGGGTSEIIASTDAVITYLRGKSKITVSFDDLFEAYTSFRGKRCTTSDLRKFNPAVFDSQARPAGHSCNATFLFTLLRHTGLAGDINGEGKSGSPFFIDVSASD